MCRGDEAFKQSNPGNGGEWWHNITTLQPISHKITILQYHTKLQYYNITQYYSLAMSHNITTLQFHTILQ